MSTADFSRTVKARVGSYFIDIYPLAGNEQFLSITHEFEIMDGGKYRKTIKVFPDSLDSFVAAIDAAYDEMKKGGV